jgi:3-hydroxyisobutyrate dehydrogenase-like beta-hydroxyacid dehydrogenase
METLVGISVGFIGLGLMGRPMSVNLMNAGATLVIYNRSRGAVDALSALGMRSTQCPAEVAKNANSIILMVSDTTAVDEVLFGDAGVIEGLSPGGLVIDMGTTAVASTCRFAEKIRFAGSDYIDAPVSGGAIGAKAGELAIMAGGSKAAVARAIPLFEVLGKKITHVGGIGAGQVAKAANQMIVGLSIGALAEALMLAQRAGVDPARVREALRGGFADSRILEQHGKRMIDRMFEPGAKATTQRKDLLQALQLGQSLGLELPATELNLSLFDRLIEQGDGDLDHSALIKVFEDA